MSLLVERARSAIGAPTVYRLGKGGRRPGAAHPRDAAGLLDCSGFVAWVMGLDRYQPANPRYKAINGGWINTDAIVRDATMGPGPGQLFRRVEVAEPGDVLVYGSYRDASGTRRVGHCGIVVVGGDWSRMRVVHCSASNGRRGDAIQETGAAWGRARGIVVRRVG
jgi:cell wall-associated NlpC family hydrolase